METNAVRAETANMTKVDAHETEGAGAGARAGAVVVVKLLTLARGGVAKIDGFRVVTTG